jgi:anti-sigma factor RsiW
MWLTRRWGRNPRLNCADVVELVTDHLEGTLSPALAARVSAHLAECDGCTTYLEQMKQTSAALRGVDLSGLPEDVCADLVEAFRDWDAS